MNKKMDDFFHLSERKTDFKTELLAGLTIFITMTYVLVTQPGAFVGFGPVSSVTDVAGLIVSKEAILLVTALISGIASIVMGLYANLPFVLSTGMGMNFVLGGMVQAGAMSFATAMTVFLIGGIIFVLLSVFGVRDIIVKSIPKNIKLGMCVIVGILLAWLGMKDAGIISANPTGGFNFGNLSEKATLLGLFTFLLMAFLHARKIKGGVLIAMILATVIGIPLGVTTLPQQIVAIPSFKAISSVSFKFDFSSALNISMFPLILIAFSTDFFASLAAFLGLGSKAGMLDEEGNLPNIKRPFLVDSSFTVIGAMFGCSTITTFAESATGIEEGGRTG
ncbi:MAG: NCS2 family permease, partial [Sphaerochaetaceae bacterium]